MGGNTSKLEFEKRHIIASSVNKFIFYHNRIHIFNECGFNQFTITHIYGLNGEKWSDHRLTSNDLTFFNTTNCVKYELQDLEVVIYLKKRAYKRFKNYMNKYPCRYISEIL